MILMMGLVPIKFAATLNASGPTSNSRFMVRCNAKNRMRKRPEMLITNFFPMDELKIFPINRIFDNYLQVTNTYQNVRGAKVTGVNPLSNVVKQHSHIPLPLATKITNHLKRRGFFWREFGETNNHRYTCTYFPTTSFT